MAEAVMTPMSAAWIWKGRQLTECMNDSIPFSAIINAATYSYASMMNVALRRMPQREDALKNAVLKNAGSGEKPPSNSKPRTI